MPRITLLRPGRFTATDGTEYSYSESDLAAIAAAYDPVSDPAPLVIGHPTMDAPAYGWIERLAVEDGALVAIADPEKLHPAFAEAVNAGHYRKVSGSFYPPDSSNNPKPGAQYLKHVGFLGAKAPAIKGLGTVHFAEGETFITVEMETTVDRTAEFAERETALTTREQELADRQTALEQREAAQAAAERAARHDGHVAFAEVLVAGGKLAPAGKDLVIGILDSLPLERGEAISFGEATDELVPAAAFKKLLEGAGSIVNFGEAARADGKGADGEQDPNAIAQRATEFAETERQAGRTISIAAAVRHVMKTPAA